MKKTKNRITLYMKLRGVTIEDLAIISGIPKPTLYSYIENKREPKLFTAMKIADSLGTEVEKLWYK